MVWTTWVLLLFCDGIESLLSVTVLSVVVGDSSLQARDSGDLLPHGGGLDLDGEPPVLVHYLLLDLVINFGLPDRLHKLTSLFSELEVYLNVILSEVGVGGPILTSQLTGWTNQSRTSCWQS